MTEAPRVSRRSRMRQFFRIALRYWRGRARWQAWGLTAAVLIFIAAQTASAVGINRWNRWFFDALEKRDVEAVWATTGWLPFLLAASALSVSGLVVSRMLL